MTAGRPGAGRCAGYAPAASHSAAPGRVRRSGAARRALLLPGGGCRGPRGPPGPEPWALSGGRGAGTAPEPYDAKPHDSDPYRSEPVCPA